MKQKIWEREKSGKEIIWETEILGNLGNRESGKERIWEREKLGNRESGESWK